jgi:Family of unknown function (DUF6402)
MDLSYFEINKLLWRWSKKDGARIVHEAKLSMEKAAPALPASPTDLVNVRPAPAQPKPDLVDDIVKVVDAFGRFKTWLNTPDPPKPPRTVPVKPAQTQTVPPFDIQEIPRAMRKEFMPNAAKLMERWFAGELNYGPTSKDVAAEINHKGEPYPPSMYDMTTIKLDWALKHQRAKEAHDELVNTLIRSSRAISALAKILRRFDSHQSIDAWAKCGEKLPNLHRHFQFQLVRVGSTFSQKIGDMVRAARNHGVPDDLTGALGSFNIYAAIGFVHFTRPGVAEVSGIYVYIKDSFDFTDLSPEVSQYLGHWSKNGVIVVPYNAAAAAFGREEFYVSFPVALGDPRVAGNVYYPVHNSDFRQWARKHGRGGDFIVYSDYKFIPLSPPIKVYL